MSFFERYLTLWISLCIVTGITFGNLFPGIAELLNSWAIIVDGVALVSLPIAICLFLMIYPIMVKIDFRQVLMSGKSFRPVALTLLINWAIKPFTMYAIATLFLGNIFLGYIGEDATDLIRLPIGEVLQIGDTYGAGRVVVVDGAAMLEVPLWRSYLVGCVLLGIAPCTAMVLIWGNLSRGNDSHTLVMVALNSVVMTLLFGLLGGFLLGVGRLPVPWEALLLSVAVYVISPLLCGYFSRQWIMHKKGESWFHKRFLKFLQPISIFALLMTLVLLFALKGAAILESPLSILWISVPLIVQTFLVFGIGYGLSKLFRLRYEDAAPTSLIGASNHFEVAIATSAMLYGLSSGAALATVVGVLIEVPLMLLLVRFCLHTKSWFAENNVTQSSL